MPAPAYGPHVGDHPRDRAQLYGHDVAGGDPRPSGPRGLGQPTSANDSSSSSAPRRRRATRSAATSARTSRRRRRSFNPPPCLLQLRPAPSLPLGSRGSAADHEPSGGSLGGRLAARGQSPRAAAPARAGAALDERHQPRAVERSSGTATTQASMHAAAPRRTVATSSTLTRSPPTFTTPSRRPVDVHVARGVDAAHVAGAQAAGPRTRAALGLVEVADHRRRAAHHQLAVVDLDLDAARWARPTDRARTRAPRRRRSRSPAARPRSGRTGCRGARRGKTSRADRASSRVERRARRGDVAERRPRGAGARPRARAAAKRSPPTRDPLAAGAP